VTGDSLLTLDQVAVGYGRHAVLSDVNLTLPRGSFSGLLGANGSGKSTLIKSILGILPPLTGRVEFASEAGRAPALGYVPQRDVFDPVYLLSSFEVVLMGTCGRVRPGRRIDAAEKEWARQCLREAGAEQLSEQMFAQLSGGQKQRVLIARALATKPDFLLLDEPTAGIDATARQSIMDVLREIHARQRLTILMASHDLLVVRTYVEHVIWLHQGRIQQGPVSQLLTPANIEEILDLEMH